MHDVPSVSVGRRTVIINVEVFGWGCMRVRLKVLLYFVVASRGRLRVDFLPVALTHRTLRTNAGPWPRLL